MDDRIELGLKIAEEIEVRNDQTLIFAAGLAAATSQSLVDFDWLLSDIKAADKSAIETTIDKMGKIDIVIQNKLREVYTEMVKPLMAAA
jgi:hypothetical protein